MFDSSDINFTVVALWKPVNQKQTYYAVVSVCCSVTCERQLMTSSLLEKTARIKSKKADFITGKWTDYLLWLYKCNNL